MKKILSVILCTAIAFAFCFQSVTVTAAGKPAIVCENKECKPGDTIVVDINIQDNPGIMYLELTPAFAPEFGEPEVQNGTVFSDFTKAKQYVWTADNDVISDGKLLSLTLNIPEETAVGDYSIGFIFRSAYDYDESSVEFNVYNSTISVKAESQTSSAKIVCQSTECDSNGAVSVDVNIQNNPGIMYLELTPVFSPELGEPDVQNGTVFPDFSKGKQYIWIADSNVLTNGKLLTLKFNVPNTTVVGKYSIGFVFRAAYDYDENDVGFSVESGIITVGEKKHISGDINGDGSVNNKDLTRLFQYLSDWDVVVNTDALDINGDGSVNNKDLTRLFQYLSDWDVQIF